MRSANFVLPLWRLAWRLHLLLFLRRWKNTMIEELAVIDAKPIKAKRIELEPMTAEESNQWVVRIKAEMDKGTELETGAMEAYRRAGAMLIQVRGRLGPRKFKPWVEQ